jgi:hypothetical protein
MKIKNEAYASKVNEDLSVAMALKVGTLVSPTLIQHYSQCLSVFHYYLKFPSNFKVFDILT